MKDTVMEFYDLIVPVAERLDKKISKLLESGVKRDENCRQYMETFGIIKAW